MLKNVTYDPPFKSRVALKGERTVSEVMATDEIHPTMINQ